MKKWILILVAITVFTSCGKLQEKLFYCNVKISVVDTDVKAMSEENITTYEEGDVLQFFFTVERHYPEDDIITIKRTMGELVYENGSWATYLHVGGGVSRRVKVDSVELTSTSSIAEIWYWFIYHGKRYDSSIDFKEGDLTISINPLLDFASVSETETM